jgi:hypothetical protein
MNAEIRIEATQFLFWEYIDGIFVAVYDTILKHALTTFFARIFVNNVKSVNNAIRRKPRECTNQYEVSK